MPLFLKGDLICFPVIIFFTTVSNSVSIITQLQRSSKLNAFYPTNEQNNKQESITTIFTCNILITQGALQPGK